MTKEERLEFRTMIEEILEDKIDPKLNSTTEKIDKLSKKLIGNGDVKGCVIWEIEELKNWRITVEQWRREIKAMPKTLWLYVSNVIMVIFVILTFIFK